MRHLPAFLDIAGRACLVVGGGEVAARKIALLERAGGRVRVNSPELVPSLLRGVAAGRLQHLDSLFSPDHLDGASLAIAATGSREVNARVSWEARRRGIPVNVVDDPALCSFLMPSIIDRDPVLIAVSTGGASPVLARWVRARIELALPASLAALGRLAQRWRAPSKRRLASAEDRRRFWERLFDGPAAALALAGRDAEADRIVADGLAGDTEGDRLRGAVYLVGAGPGDPDLLTLRAHRLLQGADVIVYDRLVSPEILDLARRDAETIYVGKAPGAHAMRQDEINALLVRLGRDGRQVVRLKGGDPFVFGRGGEEMLAVEAAGLPCHIVPGITAAAGIGAAIGVPLTHRGMAQGVSFVTGHGADQGAGHETDWATLARGDRTIVVYMGLAALPRIAANLAAHGLSADTPAVAVEKGTTADQRVIAGTLGTIADRVRAAGLTGPALTVIGAVAAFARTDGLAAGDARDAALDTFIETRPAAGAAPRFAAAG